MYLIPSFIIIPLIILIAYWLNRRFEKQQIASMNQLMSSRAEDVLFEVPAAAPPAATPVAPTSLTLNPPHSETHHAQAALLAKQQRVAALKAELARVQRQKQLAATHKDQ